MVVRRENSVRKIIVIINRQIRTNYLNLGRGGGNHVESTIIYLKTYLYFSYSPTIPIYLYKGNSYVCSNFYNGKQNIYIYIYRLSIVRMTRNYCVMKQLIYSKIAVVSNFSWWKVTFYRNSEAPGNTDKFSRIRYHKTRTKFSKLI